MKKILIIAILCILCASCGNRIPDLSPTGNNPFVVEKIEVYTDSNAFYYDEENSGFISGAAIIILPIGKYQLNDTIILP